MRSPVDRPSILIAEDNPSNVKMLKAILDDAGYNVRVATNGKAALASARAELPTLILLDVHMPELDGYSVCEELKKAEATKRVPVLFVSALSEVFNKIRAFQVGGVDYIEKPYEREEILARVRTHVELHVLRSELEDCIRRSTSDLTEANDSLLREIAEKRRVERELRKRQRELDVINRINAVFLTLPDDDIYGEVLEVVLAATESPLGVFGYIDEAGDLVVPSLTQGVWEERSVAEKAIVFPRESWGDALWQRAIRDGKAMHSNEPSSLVPEGHLPILRNIAVPILDKGEAVGLLNVANREADYTSEDVAFLERIANAVAPVLRARLQRDQQLARLARAQESRRRLATAIEQADETIMITDPDGTIQYVNPSFSRISGYSREEAIGQTPRLLRSGHHSQDFYDNLWATIRAGAVWSGRFVNRKKDGQQVHEEATISPVKDDAGTITNFVAVKRDVTLELRHEERLREAQKMDSIGTLAGGIAHDFNNILAAIMGSLEIGMDYVADRPDAQDMLRQALGAADRARDLVKQILTFSRQTQKEMKPVRLAELMEEVARFMRASLPRTIQVVRDFTARDATLAFADPTQIHQVLMNLCTNAAHAMAGGGVLRLGLTEVQQDQDERTRLSGLPAGVYARMTVSDNGSGIPPERLERIFEPYYTTKPVGEGTGLGLSVAHGIVANHRGAISVSSQVGRGTTFHVFLPVAQAVSSERAPGRDAASPTGTERILFVDDERALADISARMLERLGYDVVATTSAKEALALFRSESERFDLIITDKTMPTMTGFELAREAREIRADIPVLMNTGFLTRADAEAARAAGVREIIAKPLELRQFANAVRRVLDESEDER